MRELEDLAFGIENIRPDELTERLIIAHDVAISAPMTAETKMTIVYALCVVKTLINENPELLVNISGYLATREMKRRAKREDA